MGNSEATFDQTQQRAERVEDQIAEAHQRVVCPGRCFFAPKPDRCTVTGTVHVKVCVGLATQSGELTKCGPSYVTHVAPSQYCNAKCVGGRAVLAVMLYEVGFVTGLIKSYCNQCGKGVVVDHHSVAESPSKALAATCAPVVVSAVGVPPVHREVTPSKRATSLIMHWPPLLPVVKYHRQLTLVATRYHTPMPALHSAVPLE